MEMFKLDDIQDGYLLELKMNNQTYFVQVYHDKHDELCGSSGELFLNLSNLREFASCDGNDIVRIYGRAPGHMTYKSSKAGRDILWDRKWVKKEMTIDEIETALGYGVKIVEEHE